MSDFQMVRGFEDVWRPPVRPRQRTPQAVLSGHAARQEVRRRLERIVNRAPEVMVKVTGRTRDPGHLRAHLDYITRKGELEMEDHDGAIFAGRAAASELAVDWTTAAQAARRRAGSPLSLSLTLSMPAGTDAVALRDAARAFARDTFADRFDYAFVLHTDTPHPHVHLSICAQGRDGERLNPKKADLEAWRQTFAQALRDRGVEAEATPRRTRGVTRKAERGVLRKMRERFATGRGAQATVRRAAYREAAKAAFQGRGERTPWEARLLDRQAKVRNLYLAQAQLLRRSPDPADRILGAKVEAFVRTMPAPDSQRLALARELRTANAALGRERAADGKARER